jgi:hypothetical protein
VNDKGRYRQFRARPPEAIVWYVTPVTEIPEVAVLSRRNPQCSYGPLVAENDCREPGTQRTAFRDY